MRISLTIFICFFCFSALAETTYVGISDPNPTASLTALYNKLTAEDKKIRYGHYYESGSYNGAVTEAFKITGKDLSHYEYRAVPWSDGAQGAGAPYDPGPDTTFAKAKYDAGATISVMYPTQNLSSTCVPNTSAYGSPGGGCGLVPYSDGQRNMTGNPCDALLSTGGDPTARATYLGTLDNLAHWATDAAHFNGRAFIFRPFHEADGNWFWWGTNAASACSDADYVQLWRETVDYLRNTKNVHNILYAYAPEVIYSYTEYDGARYPGDDYVDIFGIDIYSNMDDLNTSVGCGWEGDCNVMARYREAASEAQEHGKIFAITEGLRTMRVAGTSNPGTGYRADAWTWWIDQILADPVLADIAYISPWAPPWSEQEGTGDAANFYEMFIGRSDSICALNIDGTCYEPITLAPGIYIR